MSETTSTASDYEPSPMRLSQDPSFDGGCERLQCWLRAVHRGSVVYASNGRMGTDTAR